MCIDASAARRIDADLRRFPLVLKENKALRRANGSYAVAVEKGNRALTAKDSVITTTERQLTTAKVLGRDAENRAVRWEGKARKRFWALVGETALLILVTVAAVGR